MLISLWKKKQNTTNSFKSDVISGHTNEESLKILPEHCSIYLWFCQIFQISTWPWWNYQLQQSLPVNVLSHLPAFHSLMVLSAEPVNINPCSGSIITAHIAAVWPCKITTLLGLSESNSGYLLYIHVEELHTCNVIIHLSFNQTLAVVSHDPLNNVPNFPDERLQTGTKIQISTDKYIATNHIPAV